MAHETGKKSEGQVAEFSFDFCFPGDEQVGNNLIALVGRMRHTRMTMSTVVPSKSTGEFVAKRVLAFLRECGVDKCRTIVKSDQEPAMVAILEKVRQLQADSGQIEGIIPEASPVGSHQSNGMVERGVQAVEGQVRTMRSALEERIGIKLDMKDAIWPWLIEYAGYLINRFEVGHDGKTAYERLKGKKATVLGIEFGESVHWRRRPAAREALGKAAIPFCDGVYLGVKGTTGEIIVGTGLGCFRTRTIRRKPADERWRAAEIKSLGGVPWRSSENDPKCDGERMESRPLTREETEKIQHKLNTEFE